MLCSRIKQIIFIRTSIKSIVHYQYIISSNSMLKRCVSRGWLVTKHKYSGIGMNIPRFKFIFKDLGVIRLWSSWSRSHLLSNVFKRCRRDRSVREMLYYFRQTFFRPRQTLLLSATAAFKRTDEDDDIDDNRVTCDKNITDEEIEALLTELDGVEDLSRNTLFCFGCGRRLIIHKKLPSVTYCSCKDAAAPTESEDGWVPFMEAEDVIIWRKEYKPGQGLYAYKVYGRYEEVHAQDFAAVQVDGGYRRQWDAAVASLCVVERHVNGVKDQAVLHWEVLWPRLFANRDYVYIRRHKEFDVKTRSCPHKDVLFESRRRNRPSIPYEERPSVHSNAKRKSLEAYSQRSEEEIVKDNKVYVIVSRSCEHPDVPVTKNAIRVSEYWSHMVIKTLNGADQAGMEFVLTYYDEPAVGGLPCGVANWATSRAAPAFLDRMRAAALGYRQRNPTPDENLPDFAPSEPRNSADEERERLRVSEEDMETSKQGPELNGNHKDSDGSQDAEETGSQRRDQSTQTESQQTIPEIEVRIESVDKITEDKGVGTNDAEVTAAEVKKNSSTSERDNDSSEDGKEENGSWWRYLYPFYYFA